MRGDKFVEILKTKVKVLEVTRQADDQITVLVDRNDLPLAVKTLYYDIGGFISTMMPSDERAINGCLSILERAMVSTRVRSCNTSTSTCMGAKMWGILTCFRNLLISKCPKMMPER